MLKLSFNENPIITMDSLPQNQQFMDITTSAVIKSTQIPDNVLYNTLKILSKNKYNYNYTEDGIKIIVKSYTTVSLNDNISLIRQILLAKNKLKLYTIMRDICYDLLVVYNTYIPKSLLTVLLSNCRFYKNKLIYQAPDSPQIISTEDTVLKAFYFYSKLVQTEQDNIEYLIYNY